MSASPSLLIHQEILGNSRNLFLATGEGCFSAGRHGGGEGGQMSPFGGHQN